MFYPEDTFLEQLLIESAWGHEIAEASEGEHVSRSVDKQSIWTPTHSPKARHFLFTAASGKEEASWKEDEKKNLKTTTGSLRGMG